MHSYKVLKRPVVTEKSNYLADAFNSYVFEVDPRANKHQVRDAVQEVFEVTVEKVAIMKVKGKSRRFGRHIGRTSDWKKAIVTLAAGDTISFFEGV